MRFALDTHGCRLNQAESDAIAAQLRARGHELVAVEDAELYLLNSCAITHAADADARAAIRRARRRNPELRVVITGCHANAEPEALAAMAELDAVIGNGEKRSPALAGMLESVVEGGGLEGRGAGPKGPGLIAVERLTRGRSPAPWTEAGATGGDRTRPLLKVQDGCDYQCSFCIVPRVRGRSRSAPLAQVADNLGRLLDAGAPEVVLTGAHLGTWGRDLARDQGRRAPGLAALVAGLLAARPEARLRLGSVDPHEVDAELVALLGRGVDEAGAGLCPHIHLPVQSGDDGVLRAMRRAHSVADLDQLIPRLRRAAPDIALGTDLIVGFPGESEAAFERTLALFETTAIPFAHVFVWSPRAGTPAATMGDRVSPECAARRSRVIREQVARSRRRFVEAQLGAVRSAVILRRRHPKTGALCAISDNYLKLRLAGPDSLLGRRARLRLLEVPGGGDRSAGPDWLRAQVVDT